MGVSNGNPIIHRLSWRTFVWSIAEVRYQGTISPRTVCKWVSWRYAMWKSLPHWLMQCASSMIMRLILFFHFRLIPNVHETRVDGQFRWHNYSSELQISDLLWCMLSITSIPEQTSYLQQTRWFPNYLCSYWHALEASLWRLISKLLSKTFQWHNDYSKSILITHQEPEHKALPWSCCRNGHQGFLLQ